MGIRSRTWLATSSQRRQDVSAAIQRNAVLEAQPLARHATFAAIGSSAESSVWKPCLVIAHIRFRKDRTHTAPHSNPAPLFVIPEGNPLCRCASVLGNLRRVHHPRLHHDAIKQSRRHQMVAYRTHEPQTPARFASPLIPASTSRYRPHTPRSTGLSPSPASGPLARRRRCCSPSAQPCWTEPATSRPGRPRTLHSRRDRPATPRRPPSTDSAETWLTLGGSATSFPGVAAVCRNPHRVQVRYRRSRLRRSHKAPLLGRQ